MQGKLVLLKGMLFNGEFFIGMMPKELKCVGPSAHKVIALPALIMEDAAFVKETDRGEIDNLLPNTIITSSYNIMFEGIKVDENWLEEGEEPTGNYPYRSMFLNKEDMFTKEDMKKIGEAMATLQAYNLMGL